MNHIAMNNSIWTTNSQTLSDFEICRSMFDCGQALLRTFAPIVSAHPYCARNSLRDVMPRHALSARAVEEMWRYIALASGHFDIYARV